MRKRHNKRNITIGCVLGLLAVAAVIGGVIFYNNGKQETEESDETETEQAVEEEPKEEKETVEVEEAVVSGGEVEKEAVNQYDGDNPNTANDLSGAVTYAGINGANLVIRVNIDQYLSSGTCELTLARSGATIYSSIANIGGGAATSTCEGFDVPVSNLGGGAVDIIINLSAEGRSGVIRGEADI